MDNQEWILCPNCNNKTRIKIREDTKLSHFPLFCPKCRQETLINAQQLKISIITEPIIRYKNGISALFIFAIQLKKSRQEEQNAYYN